MHGISIAKATIQKTLSTQLYTHIYTQLQQQLLLYHAMAP
jgi:hypothetical protein